ncbi:MAG: hypothetical protein JEZ00_10470 [Anaerolineaceae bacterium]|nr:hypothetical protein [Anaerolineaceae bacterium]
MKIRTVLGDIDANTLGISTCHEHLIWQVPNAPHADPDLGFDSIPAAVAEMRYFKQAGGQALVEMTTSEIGRAPLDLQQISQATEIHVIAASGHHKDKFSASALQGQSVDEIAEGIFNDITYGMDGTNIRAGIIKAASSNNEITEMEQRIITAAAIAHRETGAPVSTHTEGGTFAVEQATMLVQNSIAPEKILIGHLDRNLPMETYIKLANLGVYLGFDQIGKEKYWPDQERVSLISEMIKAGFGNRILLSCDCARKSSWHTHNPRVKGPSYLLMKFVPMLRQANITENYIQQLLLENPARFLAI